MKNAGESYGPRVGEVVGWKNQGNTLLVRMGPGESWGYGGYANLNVSLFGEKEISYYVMKLSGFEEEHKETVKNLINQ